MELTSFDRYVWAASFFGHVVLLLVLWRRGRARAFPVFTSFIVFNILRTIALYFIQRDLPGEYSNAVWAMAVPDEALQFLVLYELVVHVFRPTGVWAPDVGKTFAVVGCASVAVALPLVWLAVPPTATLGRVLVVRGLLFCAALLSELFVGMLALSTTEGLPWKTHVARIAQGLGAFSVVCVVTDSIGNYFGNEPHAYTVLSHIKNVVYVACEGYWIAMLWQDAPAPRELPESMLAQVYALQRQVEYDLARVRNWRRS
jgi:hypothetical protein